jgi:hypothetical protein
MHIISALQLVKRGNGTLVGFLPWVVLSMLAYADT